MMPRSIGNITMQQEGYPTIANNKVRLDEPDLIICTELRLFSGGSFFGGSGLCSCCGLCLSLCGCELSFLLCHGLSLGLVDCLLSLEASLHFLLLFVGHSYLELVNLCLTSLFPGGETTLSLSLVERALLHTTLKVLHEEHTFVG